LSVLREIRRELPGEDLLYVADSGHAPYGDKPSQLIEARSVAIIGWRSRCRPSHDWVTWRRI
jgi:glutamate racemase